MITEGGEASKRRAQKRPHGFGFRFVAEPPTRGAFGDVARIDDLPREVNAAAWAGEQRLVEG
jgi:hypothetical protein